MTDFERWKAKTKPLGAKRLSLPFSAKLSAQEVERAKAGLLPECMEDKWIGFLLDGEVAFYRSWTGEQIYRLPVRKSESGYDAGPLEVVDDANIYRRSGDELELKMAAHLLSRMTKNGSA